MYECYECGVDRGGSGMREDGNCIDCGPVTKKKLKRRVEELIEAHDRLTAENAELRKWREERMNVNFSCTSELIEAKREVEDLKDALQTSERKRNEGACYFDELISKRDRANRNIVDRNERLWRCVETAIRIKNKYYRQFAAANATLDALRDLCGPNKTISNSTCMKLVDILYPQPKETTDDER